MRAAPAALCTAALVLPLAGTGQAAAHPHPPTPTPGSQEILRERTDRLDLYDYRWLCSKHSASEPLLHSARKHYFDLFPDVQPAVVEDGRQQDGTSLTWTGHLREEPEHKVVLSATGLCDHHPDVTKVGIDAEFDFGARVYRIAMLPERPGWVRVTEEDPALRPKPPADDADFAKPPGPLRETPKETPRPVKARAAGDPVVIDMIVGYTPAAAARVGGEQAMVSRIQLAETYLNQAFADSNVQASVDVIGWYNTNYYGDQTAAVMLPKLQNARNTELGARAAQLREQYGVDLVSVINDVPYGSSGQASLPVPINAQSDSQAFSVVDVQSIVNWYNFGHEIGHNLGLFHDRTTLTQQLPGQDYRPYLTTPYSTGYITADHRFHTLMAYSSACGQPCSAVNQYSNTENTWNGQPLGDRDNNNAAVARTTTPIVAGYRTLTIDRQRYALTLSSSPGGSVRPSTYGPYRPGTTVTLRALPAPGYRVAWWEADGIRYDDLGTTQPTITMDRAHTVTAAFTQI
ncbi:reprolysin-like metallopeptidase [Streptomyces melanogenes]|uniref:reprolysin-like metallopeptidase n=1 Tax=Streptomyces melanogenes TaxID=67326 RepID=UPI00378A1820